MSFTIENLYKIFFKKRKEKYSMIPEMKYVLFYIIITAFYPSKLIYEDQDRKAIPGLCKAQGGVLEYHFL
jgi:hypothetical protein